MYEHLPRVITRRELRRLVPYTPQHIFRLEKKGKFPKRIKVGERRVGWWPPCAGGVLEIADMAANPAAASRAIMWTFWRMVAVALDRVGWSRMVKLGRQIGIASVRGD